MKPVEQELSNAYQNLPDEEIASLYAQFDSLTETARNALTLEIERRGLVGSQLQKMHATELRREKRFDGRESVRRKGLASWILFRGNLRGTIVMFVLLLLFFLIYEFMTRHR